MHHSFSVEIIINYKPGLCEIYIRTKYRICSRIKYFTFVNKNRLIKIYILYLVIAVCDPLLVRVVILISGWRDRQMDGIMVTILFGQERL